MTMAEAGSGGLMTKINEDIRRRRRELDKLQAMPIEQLADRARGVVDRISQEDLPKLEEELPEYIPDRAWTKLDFLRKVAKTPEVGTYLRRTGKRIRLAGLGPMRKVQDVADVFAWGLTGIHSGLHWGLDLESDGPLLRWGTTASSHREAFKKLWDRNIDRTAVKKIAGLDLEETLDKVKSVIK